MYSGLRDQHRWVLPEVLRDQHRWVLPEVLREQARKHPGKRWIETTDGGTLTFGQADAEVSRVAGFLAGLGVGHGDMVAVFLPNGLDFVGVWLGLGRRGAVAVLLNIDLTGSFLRHQLESCGAALAAVDRARLDALRSISGGLTHLRRIIVVDAEKPFDAGPFETIDWSAWRSAISYEGASPRSAGRRLHHVHIGHQRALQGRADASCPLLPVRPRCD